MTLSKEHIRLLKDISKGKLTRSDKNNLKDIEYLTSIGLVESYSCDKEEEFYLYPVLIELGKAVLYERTNASFRSNIALTLSIISILLSFLVAFTPSADWSKQLLSRLF